MYTVAFVGLPSSGKTTLINSLLGKKILYSEVSKPTTKARIIDTVITDDDNNKFKVIDLPGISTSEGHDTINNLIYEYILKANLIFWVSDITNVFNTTHKDNEVNEFNKIQEYLNKKSVENIQLYDIGIILTKYDERVYTNNDNVIHVSDLDDDNDEIKDLSKDTNLTDLTNITDIIINHQENFKDIKIKLFNAFGRIHNYNKSSNVINNFINTLVFSVPVTKNISFNITDYIKTHRERQDQHTLDILYNEFPTYSNNVYNDISYNRIIRIYNLLDKKPMITFLKTTFSTYVGRNVWNYFKFLNYTYNNYNSLFRDNGLFKLYIKIYLKVLLIIIDTNSYSKSINLVRDYTFESIKLKFMYHKEKNKAYFDTFFRSNSNNFMLLELYNIEENNNDFMVIQTILYTAFETMNTCVVNRFHNWLINKLEKFTYLQYDPRPEIHSYLINDIHGEIISNMCDKDIVKYLYNLNILVNNKYYILLNKASVYKILFIEYESKHIWTNWTTYREGGQCLTDIYRLIPLTYHYNYVKKHCIKYKGIYNRLSEMPEFENLITIGMNNIYNNIEFKIGNINNIKPLNISEVIGHKKL